MLLYTTEATSPISKYFTESDTLTPNACPRTQFNSDPNCLELAQTLQDMDSVPQDYSISNTSHMSQATIILTDPKAVNLGVPMTAPT